MIEILLLYALCGTSFTISKAVLLYAKPIFFVGVRMIIAGVILLGYLYARRKHIKINPRDYWYLGGMILFHVYFAFVLDLWALQFLTSFKSAFLFNLSPFITALLSYMLFSETITTKKWLGMLIGTIGCLPMLIKDSPTEGILNQFGLFSLAEIAMIGAVFSSCLGWTLMRLLVAKRSYDPIAINGIAMFGGGLLALLTSALTESWLVSSPVFNWQGFTMLTLLIIFLCNMLYYTMYSNLLKRYTATLLSFFGFTCPLFAALYGALFLKEHVTRHFYISTLILAIGLYIFYQEELRQRYR